MHAVIDDEKYFLVNLQRTCRKKFNTSSKCRVSDFSAETSNTVESIISAINKQVAAKYLCFFLADTSRFSLLSHVAACPWRHYQAVWRGLRA